MEFMDIIDDLYSKYINDSQYVYYKYRKTIIIMKKMSDDNTCLSYIPPKKYYSSTLKVILMFDITDPYKLVYDLPQYKMNDIVNSYYYESIKEASSLYQYYYKSGQKFFECNYIDNQLNGLYHCYYSSGQLEVTCNYINDKLNGLYQEYYENGQLKIECNYINGKFNGLYL